VGPTGDPPRRWFAWCDGARVEAAQRLGTGVVGRAGGEVRGLAGARVASPGALTADGGASFVVAGEHNGRAAVGVARVGPGAGFRFDGPAELDLGEAVGHLSVGLGPGAGEVTVVYTGRTGAGGVRARTLGLDGAALGAAQMLFARKSPLVALAVSSSREVRALHGPEPDLDDGGREVGRSMVLLRMPLDGGAEPRASRLRLDPPPPEALASADALHPFVRLWLGEDAPRWALGAGAAVAVAVHVGESVLAARGDGFAEVARPAAGATAFHIQAARKGPSYAAWVEPALGLRLAPIG
jgi:hypothetical protein